MMLVYVDTSASSVSPSTSIIRNLYTREYLSPGCNMDILPISITPVYIVIKATTTDSSPGLTLKSTWHTATLFST